MAPPQNVSRLAFAGRMGNNETKIALAVIHILLVDKWTKESISRAPHKLQQTPLTLNETNSNIMNEQIAC